MVFCTVNASKSNIHNGEPDVIYNKFAILWKGNEILVSYLKIVYWI